MTLNFSGDKNRFEHNKQREMPMILAFVHDFIFMDSPLLE